MACHCWHFFASCQPKTALGFIDYCVEDEIMMPIDRFTTPSHRLLSRLNVTTAELGCIMEI